MKRTIFAAIIAVAAMALLLDDRARAVAEVNDEQHHPPFTKSHVFQDRETNGRAPRPTEQTARRCGDTPQDAVLTFLRGIGEFDLTMLRSVVPNGISLFALFGEGDTERGRTVVRRILEPPELSRGNEVDSTYVLLEMRDRGDGEEKEIHIERRDRVWLMRQNMHEAEQVYRRVFLVRFEPRGNCIVRVKPIGEEWNRTR